MRACKLNNMQMNALRKNITVQGVFIDLALIGAIDKDLAEHFLGYRIPESICLPKYMREEGQ